MPINVQQPRSQSSAPMERLYSSDILPHLQSLLADLADIDFACEKSLERIRHSQTDEDYKHRMIVALQQRHQEQRAPYVQELTALEERIRTALA